MKFLVVQMPEKPIDCPFSKGNFRSGHNCEVGKGKCTLLTSGCEYMIPISLGEGDLLDLWNENKNRQRVDSDQEMSDYTLLR